jgi:hypothetical protein
MKALYQLSSIALGAALVFSPALGITQQNPSPETAIPRHTHRGGGSNMAPPADRKAPPDTHHDIQAHAGQSNHARQKKKTKEGSSGSSADSATGSGTEGGNSH